MGRYNVLSTKKLEAALIEQARQNDIEIIEKPLISVKSLFNQETFNIIREIAKAEKSYIALTSANAVEALSNYLSSDEGLDVRWNVFCLSGRTKQAVVASEFSKNIIAEAKDASELAKRIIQSGVKEIIFFCGSKRRDELPALLKKENVKLREVVLYETLETPVKVDTDLHGILFFSPSAVRSFFQENQLGDQTVLFAIGNTTAEEIKSFSKNKLIVSEVPDSEALLGDMITYFQTNPIHPVRSDGYRADHPGGL